MTSTLRELGILVGMSAKQVEGYLRKAPLAPVHRGTTNKNDPSRWDETEALAILQPIADRLAARDQPGLISHTDAAEVYGKARQTIARILKRYAVSPVCPGDHGFPALYDAEEVGLAMFANEWAETSHVDLLAFWDVNTDDTYELDEDGLKVQRITPRDGVTYIRSITSLWADATKAFRNDPTYIIRMMEDARDILDGVAA